MTYCACSSRTKKVSEPLHKRKKKTLRRTPTRNPVQCFRHSKNVYKLSVKCQRTMNPMPSSTARKPMYDRTIFAGRKNGEVEFMGAKKMYHIKATRKVIVSAILLPLGTPSLNVVIFGTSIWVVDGEYLGFTFF